MVAWRSMERSDEGRKEATCREKVGDSRSRLSRFSCSSDWDGECQDWV
jgi:hypothetical protein